jgi:tRNA (guanine37-N1)-methyltransferase
MTPRGAPLTQARVRGLAAGEGVTILCGRFEGIDERLFEARDIEQVSIGDYILSGGEMAALTLLDACIRLLPGVMGAPSSGVDESFETGLLEYPQYTRPAMNGKGARSPKCCDRGIMRRSRLAKAQAEIDTRLRRPDLWERHEWRSGPVSLWRAATKQERQVMNLIQQLEAEQNRPHPSHRYAAGPFPLPSGEGGRREAPEG